MHDDGMFCINFTFELNKLCLGVTLEWKSTSVKKNTYGTRQILSEIFKFQNGMQKLTYYNTLHFIVPRLNIKHTHF